MRLSVTLCNAELSKRTLIVSVSPIWDLILLGSLLMLLFFLVEVLLKSIRKASGINFTAGKRDTEKELTLI